MKRITVCQLFLLIVLLYAVNSGWSVEKAGRFVSENARIPIGTEFSQEIGPVVLIGLVKVSEEQGEYAAKTALRILDGEKPADIPVVSNKRGDLFINLEIADKLSVIFTPAIMRNAKTIIGLDKKGQATRIR